MTSERTSDERLVIYGSRKKALLLLMGAVAFVAAGVWIAGSSVAAARVSPARLVVATYIGIPFFAVCALYFGYRLARPRPAVIADRSGLTDSASAVGAGHLPWSDIAYVVPYEFSGQAMLGVVPHDIDALLERQGWLRKRLMKVNIGMGTPPLNIPEGILPMSVAELAAKLHSSFGVRVEVEM